MSTEKKARLNEIVSVDPDLMHGAPCFRGTRVPVRLLLDDLRSGSTIDEFWLVVRPCRGNSLRDTLSWLPKIEVRFDVCPASARVSSLSTITGNSPSESLS
jgi:hypothetical protein